MALKGTPAERRLQKTERRRANEVQYLRQLGQSAQTGHDKVVAATQAAKAASRRLTDDASRALAWQIAQVVDRFDVEENWSQL